MLCCGKTFFCLEFTSFCADGMPDYVHGHGQFFLSAPHPSPGVLLLSPLLVGVKPYNAQTGTTLHISMTLILWLTFIRPRKPRKATRTWWEFNSSRILHAANPNKLLASQSQSIVGSSTTLFCFNRTGQNKLIIDLINWRLLVMRVLWPFLSLCSCELSKNRGSSSFIPLFQVAV